MLIIVLWILTMIVYIRLRRKYAYSRFLAEGIILTFVIIIAIVGRFAYLKTPDIAPSAETGLWNIILFQISRFLMTIYTVFGAFQFGDLPDTAEFSRALGLYFFISSSLYAGLVVISIVTTKVSYEMFSRVGLSTARKNNIEVYVFQDLNNDTLKLAKSIAAKHAGNNGNKKAKRIRFFKKDSCLIVFSGDNLAPFNRHDPLCIEVMKNGFYYYPHQRPEGTALLQRLKLLKPFKELSVFERKKVHFFALGQTGENHVADEVSNIKAIFSELENIFTQYKNQKNDKKFVNRIFRFYILTRDDLPYEKFEAQKLAILKKVFPKVLTGPARNLALAQIEPADIKILQGTAKLEKKLFEKFAELFAIHIVNEANLAAREFSRKRSELLYKNNQIIPDIMQNDDMYLSLFLGFGKTNEKVLDQLYIDTSAINKKFEEIHFAATIVDVNLNARIGVYSAKHPYYIVIEHSDGGLFDKTPSIRSIFDIKLADPNDKTSLTSRYQAITKEIAKKDFEANEIPEIKLPLISYLEESCTSDRFLNLLDRSTGAQVGKFHSFNTIVIALGEDDMNINLANVIINDARRELLRGESKPSMPQLIAVHIANPSNYFKLQTADSSDEEENAILKDLNVIAFGDISESYSFENIIDEKFAKLVNAGYENMSGYIYDSSEIIKGEIDEQKPAQTPPDKSPLDLSFDEAYAHLMKYDKAINKNFTETCYYLFSKVKDGYSNEAKWIAKNDFKKESNAQVLLYELTAKTLANYEIPSEEKIKWLSGVEHIRWNRFYIANGWRYNKNRNDQFLRHDCLTSLDLVPELKNLFDIVNIALLVNIDELRK